MDSLSALEGANKLTSRGGVRRLVPSASIVVLLAVLVSWAHDGPLTLPRFDGVTFAGGAFLLVATAAAAVLLTPAFAYVGAVLQGTSGGGRLLRPLWVLGVRLSERRAAKWHQRLVAAVRARHWGPASAEGMHLTRQAERQLSMMPTASWNLRPTMLGNVLAAADEYCMTRYGLWPEVALPRLLQTAPAEAVAEFRGQREDLQFATDLTAALTVATVASVPLASLGLWNHQRRVWLLVPLVLAVLALLAYRVAVLYAVTYAQGQRVMCDLHRGAMYTKLGLTPASDPEDDRKMGMAVSRAFITYWAPNDDSDAPDD